MQQPPSGQNWPQQGQEQYGYGQPSQPLPPNTQWGQMPYAPQQGQRQQPPSQPLPSNTQGGQQPYPPQYAQPEHYIEPGTYYRPPSQIPPQQGQWQAPYGQTPPIWQQNLQQPAKQSSNALRNAIIVFIIFVVFSGAGIRFLQSLASPLPAVGGTWTTTHTFTGNGIQKTAIFSVSDDWKILYTCSDQQFGGTTVNGAFGVIVYGSDNTAIDVAVNATCNSSPTTGSTEEHQGGNIFLAMNGTGDWTVQIQEPK